MKVKWLSHVRLSTNTYIWNLGNGTDKPISRQNQRHRHRGWTCIQNGEGESGIEIDTPLLLFLFSHQVLHDSFVTPWTVAQQVPLSIGFPRQEYWSGLPFSSPRDLPDPGIELTFFALAGGFFITEPPGKSIQFSSVQFSRSVVSDSLRPHGSQHARPPCPSPTPGVHSDSRPSSQ